GTPISRDVTGEEFYSTIYSLQESPLKQGLIWVGANDGPVHLTRDGGANWKQVTPRGLPPGGRVDAVAPSPHDPACAYIAVLRYQLGDDAPYIYKTNNYGRSWKRITNGIPADYPVRVVRADPNRVGLLYAGTEFGMFISFDDGDNWQPFQQNLPITPVTDIKIKEGDLVLSTMGRGFQIADDLSPLHQKYDQIDTSTVTLFQPRSTYRYRNSRSYSDGVISYPTAAVNIYYYLPHSTTNKPLRLEIVNETGKVVRAFRSGTMETPLVESDMSTNETIYQQRSALQAGTGLHRFKWDMRHYGAWDSNDKRAYNGGCMASPGRYELRLSCDGQTYTQSFELLLDPRVAATGVQLQDVQEQEQIALALTDLLSRAKRYAAAVEEKMLTSTTEMQAKWMAIHRQLVTVSGSYQQPMLIDQIRYLYGVIRERDQAVGNDVKLRLTELEQELSDLLKIKPDITE
ncbi:MAG: hypothetical protein AAGK47_07600, partial [Bacteroidota bacterium]